MSKSILNQRYCYKINSDYIRRNKGKVEIKNIRKGIKNRFIVGIGDSDSTRNIRDIIDSEFNEEYINKIREEIKKIRKNLDKSEDKNKLKLRLKELNNNLLEASLQDKICNVVFKTDSDYDKYSVEGFILNGKRYEPILGTPGGIKCNSVVFVEDSVNKELEKRINNGADFSIPTMPSKLMAHKALTFSSSTPVTNTPNILVVEDVEIKFKDNVIHIKFDDDKIAPTVEEIEDYEVINNACDGCGLIRPKLANKWGMDLRLNYTPTSFVIRNAWLKGVVTAFDFEEYANSREDMRDKKVIDVWGKEWDLKDVDMIINRSMLKLSKHYKSLEHYLKECEKNNHGFSVTKYVHDEIDNERMLNYQYIQCLNLSDENIYNLLQKDITEIKEVIGDNYIKSILYGRGKDLNDRNVWTDDIETRHINALMINKDCINDSYIRDRIRRSIQKRVNTLKTGKISVNGNYQVAIGEPVIKLENMFGLEPKGLLKSGEFYIEYWRNLGVDKVAAFRSPMSCKQNARVMEVCNRDEVVKWYGNFKNIIVFNAWDTTMAAMNGEDFDGDINFTTSNEILIKGIYDLPTIFCEGKNSKKISNPTKEDFMKAIKDGFGNKVGSVTNFGSSCYDKISLFEEGSEEYKELDYRIMCIQYLQQECIDSAKNGIPPRPIPSHWLNYSSVTLNVDKETGEILDDEETIKWKEFNQKVLTEKKPYYFRYIYNDVNREYLNYIKSMEINSLRNFRKSIEELISTENKTEVELDFVKYYEKHMPVSNNPCIVNKIAAKVENVFDGDFKYSRKDNGFNYELYKSNDEYTPTNSEVKGIVNLYQEYKKAIKNKDDSGDKENKKNSSIEIFDEIKMSASEIIANKQHLSNVLVDLAYKKNKISKSFVWSMVGEVIIENLLSKSNYIIEYPKRDSSGDIRFNGEKFKMTKLQVKERC